MVSLASPMLRNTNLVEAEITLVRARRKPHTEDHHLWKGKKGFKSKFSTRETWQQLRSAKPVCNWAKGVWFPQATPKFAFITWLSTLNRLSTGDRMLKWNRTADSSCSLCNHPLETRNHLFFHCPYSQQIWSKLTSGFLGTHATSDWEELTTLISGSAFYRVPLLFLRYSLQATVHTIWQERNNHKHGEDPRTAPRLEKHIEKIIRNRLLLLLNSGHPQHEDILTLWFSTRT